MSKPINAMTYDELTAEINKMENGINPESVYQVLGTNPRYLELYEQRRRVPNLSKIRERENNERERAREIMERENREREIRELENIKRLTNAYKRTDEYKTRLENRNNAYLRVIDDENAKNVLLKRYDKENEEGLANFISQQQAHGNSRAVSSIANVHRQPAYNNDDTVRDLAKINAQQMDHGDDTIRDRLKNNARGNNLKRRKSMRRKLVSKRMRRRRGTHKRH
jgi:hypothetical protein